MPLIYITGSSGAGKTTICQELLRRGYEAHGTDEDGIAAYYDIATGGKYTGGTGTRKHTPEWSKQYEWRADRAMVAALKPSAPDKTVFLCGIVANDAQIWDLFDTVFALIIDEQTLKSRIASRTNNHYGKAPHELAKLLAALKHDRSKYRKLGAHLIDATRSVAAVTDEVLQHSGH